MFQFLNPRPLKEMYQQVQEIRGLLKTPEKIEIEEEPDDEAPDKKLGRSPTIVFSLSVVIFMIALATFITALSIKPSDNQCARQLSSWSPALDAVEYLEFDFQNKFDEPSIYRGPPTKERELAWAKLWQFGAVRIPPEKMILLNRTLDQEEWRQVPPEKGPGYAGLLDVFHQLHCLDFIRQYTWLLSGNYAPIGEGTATRLDIPGGFRTSAVGNRMHADHCIETIRKTLMCHGDVTPVLAIEDPGSPLGRRADFNIHQKCRNFEKLQGWISENWAVP